MRNGPKKGPEPALILDKGPLGPIGPFIGTKGLVFVAYVSIARDGAKLQALVGSEAGCGSGPGLAHLEGRKDPVEYVSPAGQARTASPHLTSRPVSPTGLTR